MLERIAYWATRGTSMALNLVWLSYTLFIWGHLAIHYIIAIENASGDILRQIEIGGIFIIINLIAYGLFRLHRAFRRWTHIENTWF